MAVAASAYSLFALGDVDELLHLLEDGRGFSDVVRPSDEHHSRMEDCGGEVEKRSDPTPDIVCRVVAEALGDAITILSLLAGVGEATNIHSWIAVLEFLH